MFIVLKGKKLALALVFLIVAQLALTAFLCVRELGKKPTALIDYTVVIDAGHGGIDGGVYVEGVKESTLNLKYALELGKIFSNAGFNVVYTRKNEDGLYGLPTNGFKSRDMKARKKIIDESRADAVISVHMNRYSGSSRSGPQVFFQKDKEDGKIFADSVQTVFNTFTGENRQALAGDYYICREIACPSVIVECGFLSNPEEREKLQTDNYREKLCSEIFNGFMFYLYSK